MDSLQRKNLSTSYPQGHADCMAPDQAADLEQLYETPHWYAVYTCANREKLVAAQFEVRGIEHFLPVYTSVREWSDRRVKLQLPLFPGYLFVFTALRGRLPILTVPGVVNLVGTGRHPVPLGTGAIETLRNGIQKVAAQPHPYLTIGQRVSICAGPLKGFTGILVRQKAAPRVVISIEEIKQSFLAEVDAHNLVPMGPVIGSPLPAAWNAAALR
jgi:transcription antitermination factor NusG